MSLPPPTFLPPATAPPPTPPPTPERTYPKIPLFLIVAFLLTAIVSFAFGAAMTADSPTGASTQRTPESCIIALDLASQGLNAISNANTSDFAMTQADAWLAANLNRMQSAVASCRSLAE